MRIEGSKFVVVGGAGLIGSHTVDLLLQEDVEEVVVFDNFKRGSMENLTWALTDSRVTVVEGNVEELRSVQKAFIGANGVFHFAARSLLHCYEHPRDGFEVNLAGTFNVLEACREPTVQRLVFSSSASVYGDALEDPISESHPFNNTTFYGATKIGDEAMIKAFYHSDGLDYVGLRYFNVYGPRQDYKGAYVAVIMKMLDSLERNEALMVYGDGSQSYDFVSVGDCARANVVAMTTEVVDRFYNVCTGIGTSIRELAETLIDLTGKQVEIEYLPEKLSFVTRRIGDPTTARDDLGFVAKTNLVDGLRELLKYRAESRRGSSRTQ